MLEWVIVPVVAAIAAVILTLALVEEDVPPVGAVLGGAGFGLAAVVIFRGSERSDAATHEQLHLAILDPTGVPRVPEALAEIERGEVVTVTTTRRKPALIDRAGVQATPKADPVAWSDVTAVTAEISHVGSQLPAHRWIDIANGERRTRLSLRPSGFVPVFAIVVALTPDADHQVRSG